MPARIPVVLSTILIFCNGVHKGRSDSKQYAQCLFPFSASVNLTNEHSGHKTMKRLIWRENHGDKDGDTVLHISAAKGNFHLLHNSLLMGCKVNDQNNLGWTPLMQAAKNGHSTCAKLLIDFGADVTIRNRFAASGDLDTVKVILKTCISKGIKFSDIEKNISPVIFAVLKDNIDILRYLEKYGFNLNKSSKIGGVLPVTCATILKHKNIKGFYKRRGIMAVNIPSPKINTPTGHIFSTPASTTYSILPELPTFSFSPYVPTTPFNTPDCQSPHVPVSLLQVKKRKSSNFSGISPKSLTPNLSPIKPGDNSFHSACSFSPSIGSDISNSLMNSRIKLIFSSSSNDSFKVPNKKTRSASYNIPTSQEATNDYLRDDVFVLPNAADRKDFVEMLRRNSLDSCISLFEKHEIDMDLFVTLSKSDLDEIGVDWEKRDEVLKLIYQCNKLKM